MEAWWKVTDWNSGRWKLLAPGMSMVRQSSGRLQNQARSERQTHGNIGVAFYREVLCVNLSQIPSLLGAMGSQSRKAAKANLLQQ